MHPSNTPAPSQNGGNVLPPLTEKLLTIMEEMTNLLEIEIPLIQSHHYTEHTELLKRKQELTLDYQAALQSLAQNSKAINDEDRVILKERGVQLEKLARHNAIAIEMAHSATERLLRVMMDEVRKDLMKNSQYSGKGHLSMAESNHAGPVACNQSV